MTLSDIIARLDADLSGDKPLQGPDVKAIRDALAAMQWRPIEEAPKDGLPVLCLNADTGEMRVGVRKLYSNQHYENTGRHWYEWFRDDENCPGHTWSIEPTHFMPLPPPPTDEGTESDAD